jgi:hypothetical protein
MASRKEERAISLVIISPFRQLNKSCAPPSDRLHPRGENALHVSNYTYVRNIYILHAFMFFRLSLSYLSRGAWVNVTSDLFVERKHYFCPVRSFSTPLVLLDGILFL